MVVANILDPVHDTLDPTVWDATNEHYPVLKPQHKHWILDTIDKILREHGYGDMEKWLEVYLTGSLTTFQYSDDSDCDVSLFVNTEVFPEWSRAEMIGVMVSHFDGTILPGTTHPMQGYVVAQGIRPDNLFKPGLRSGYLIVGDRWLVPPERDRSHDVAREQNADYQYALEQADKMERLLRYEPDKAVKFWHQIHSRRMADQKMGKGDYSQSNIIYKFLANRGLFPEIADVSGEYIAKTAGLMPHPGQVEVARQRLNLEHPVRFMPSYRDTRGGYAGMSRDPMTGQDSHLIYFNPEDALGPRNWAVWHELAHAAQHERGDVFAPTHNLSDPEYWELPKEQEAETIANQHADLDLWKTAASVQRAKFVYDPRTHSLALGQMGAQEGENLTHAQLADHLLAGRHNDLINGDVGSDGYGQTYPRRSIGDVTINPHEAQYGAEESVRRALPGVKFINPAELLRPEWDKGDPTVVYAGEPPTIHPRADEQSWDAMFSSTNTEGLYDGQETQLTIEPPRQEEGRIRRAHRQTEALASVSGNLWSVSTADEVASGND